MSSTFADRRKALEDSFFKEREASKIAELRADLVSQKKREELQATSGIEDSDLLSALVGLDVGAGDIAALSLVPLVRVAWADGSVSEKERDAILQAAAEQGIRNNGHAHQLLDTWLDHKPGDALFTAWTEYVSTLCSQMNAEQRNALKESVVGLAHDVASAAGGILGIGAISAAEKSVLSAITQAFE